MEKERRTGGGAGPEVLSPKPEEPRFARGSEPNPKYDPTAELAELEANFDRCLAGLAMCFQPVVHANTRARFGYEALLRSADPALPDPGAMLDAAERLERVPVLGRAVRAHVAKIFASEPEERGVVFVNLHLLDLFDKQLVSPFSPLSKLASRVVLEISEKTSVDGHVDLPYRLAELREVGFRIAIDDLGSTAQVETDFVKLDMSLVRDVDKHVQKQQLVRQIAAHCHEHRTQVIGKGVETEAEARLLLDLGCDYLQGFLIAKPALPFA